jgi:hypothetical protein
MAEPLDPTRAVDPGKDAENAKILQRLADYMQSDMDESRARLVALWRRYHPEAAQEAPSYLKPLVLSNVRQPGDHASKPDEYWNNDTYHITVRRYRKDPVFQSEGGMVQLGISSLDGTARHDWRDFQAIKNQLAGAECEAFELYPAESRLLDPSNYYTLWCFPGVRRIKIGNEKRDVLDADRALAPQRGFRVPDPLEKP